MKPALSVKQVFSQVSAIRRAVKNLAENDVYIGVPAKETGSREGGINNAELSYIHEFGAPAAGIPARPHLLPGIEQIVPDAASELKEAARLALQGNEKAVDAAFKKIGLLGQNAVRSKFQANDWPPLKDATLDYKPLKKDDQGNTLKNKKGQPLREKSRREKGKVNPLIDTAQLMKSHTWVIRKKQGCMISGGGNGA